MGLFFDVASDKDRQLLEDYDAAVDAFRSKVSAAMDDVAANHPSVAPLMKSAAEAVRARPLPSEVNADEAALKRLTMSSLTVELAFSKLKNYAETEADFSAAMDVANQMREISKETIGQPQFRPLTAAVLQLVGEIRGEVAREMDERVLALYVAEVGSGKSAKPAPRAPKP